MGAHDDKQPRHIQIKPRVRSDCRSAPATVALASRDQWMLLDSEVRWPSAPSGAQPRQLQISEMQPISTGRCRHIALRRAYRSESDRLAFAGHAMGRACEATKWALGNRAGPLFIGSGGAMAFRRSGQLIPEPFPTGQYTVTDDHWLLRRGRTDSPRPLRIAARTRLLSTMHLRGNEEPK
jgi:hypothetical protein